MTQTFEMTLEEFLKHEKEDAGNFSKTDEIVCDALKESPLFAEFIQFIKPFSAIDFDAFAAAIFCTGYKAALACGDPAKDMQ